MRKALTLLLLAAPASAQSGVESLGYIALALGILSLLYSHNLTRGKRGLEAQIAREKAILKKLRGEVQTCRDELEKHRIEAQAAVDEKTASEIRKAGESAHVMRESDGLRKEYWDRLGHMGVAENAELKKLLDEKQEIEGMIELTKAKYHTRAIDEKSFSDITEEYQKKLIELEAKIRKLKGEGDGG